MKISRVKDKEEKTKKGTVYDAIMKRHADARKQAQEGKVVLRGKEIPWERARQGYFQYFISPNVLGPPINNMTFFIQDIRKHSGRHVHQGGTAIFVLEGEGYTIVDGKRIEWEKGDMILLPVKPGGVEHQHFNRLPGQPCKWLAISYPPIKYAMGSIFEQREEGPDWRDE